MGQNMDNDVPKQHFDEPVEDHASPGDQITRLLDDVRKVVRAELDYFHSRVDYTRFVFRWAWRYGAIAAFSFGSAGIALVMGIVLTLSPKVGPLAATLIVTLSFAMIGGIAAFHARKWFRKIYFPEINGDGNG